MAITWTIIVLGALLHDMQCTSTDSALTTMQTITNPISSSSTNTKNPPLTASQNSTAPASPNLTTPASPNPTTPTSQNPTTPTSQNPTTPTSQNPTTPAPQNPTTPASPNLTTPASQNPTTLADSEPIMTSTTPTSSNTIPTSLIPITTTSLNPSATITDASSTSLSTKELAQQPGTSDSTQQVTTQPTTTSKKATPTESNLSSQNTISVSQDTTSSNKPATTTHKENGTDPVSQTAVTINPAPDSTSAVSQSIPTTKAQATSTTIKSVNPAASTSSPGNITHPVYDLSNSSEGNIILETCKMLGQKMKGNCSVTLEIQGNQLIATVIINADQKIPTERYNPPEQTTEVSKETIPDTLIAILASSGALVLILCCFAAYCTYHRRSYRKNQHHLTEEMQTVENGYHDNPTLEVMEVQPEMQEKKLALNGEFNDSWIVPIDNLLKEDILDEEDTHL